MKISVERFLLTLSVFLLLGAGYFHPITAFTQDLGRHLITGKIIVQTLSVPKTNMYSYTYPDFPFINHHWFSEVLFYLIFQLTGSVGMQLLTLFVIGTAFALVFYYKLKKRNIFAVTLVSIVYLRVLFERTDVRPELFSFVFVSFFVTTLYSYRQHPTRLIYLLIPIAFLWVNTHIYFFVGIFIFFLFILDALIINLLKRKKIFIKETGILITIFFVCCFVTLINPNGIKGALYPLTVFNNYGYRIEENQTIFFLETLFSKPTIPFFKLSVALLFLSFLLTIKKTRPIDLLLAVSFTIVGAIAVRNFPLFVFVTFIPAVRSLSILFNSLYTIYKLDRYKRPFIISGTLILTAIILWNISIISSQKKLGFGIEAGAKKTADFFIDNKVKGPLFNNFDIGGYLIYRLYPREKIFIDGRPEAYPVSFFNTEYIPMQENPAIFDTLAQKHNINSIFFAHTDQTPWSGSFLKTIVAHPAWKIVHIDDYGIVLVKENKQNKELIKKFSRDWNNLKNYTYDARDINALYRLVNFFGKVGWDTPSLQALEQILKLKPNDCYALYYLSTVPHETASLYASRYQQLCLK